MSVLLSPLKSPVATHPKLFVPETATGLETLNRAGTARTSRGSHRRWYGRARRVRRARETDGRERGACEAMRTAPGKMPAIRRPAKTGGGAAPVYRRFRARIAVSMRQEWKEAT